MKLQINSYWTILIMAAAALLVAQQLASAKHSSHVLTNTTKTTSPPTASANLLWGSMNQRLQVLSTGSGYKVNDLLTLVGGTVVSGFNPALFKVTQVNTNGAITQLQRAIGAPASEYSAIPANPASLSGGSGDGSAQANVTWTLSGGFEFPTGVTVP